MRKVLIAAAMASVLTLTTYALNPDYDVVNEHNAVWGSEFRDYLCDSDGNLVETDASESSFKLKVNDKEGEIESVKIIRVSKGPNGQSVETSGDKFIAVEVILGTPDKPKKDDFYVEYTVEVKRDIENGDGDEMLSKGDELTGSWEGTGRYEMKTATSTLSISENEENVVIDSPERAINSVVRFGSDAVFAVHWSTREDPHYLSFSTDIFTSGMPEEYIQTYSEKARWIRFKGKPSFGSFGRLMLKGPSSYYAYEKKDKGWEEMEDAWYVSEFSGYMLETGKLTEYIISPVKIDRDGNEKKEAVVVSSSQVPVYTPNTIPMHNQTELKPESSSEAAQANPYLQEWLLSQESSSTEEVDVSSEVEGSEPEPVVEPEGEPYIDHVEEERKIRIREEPSKPEAVEVEAVPKEKFDFTTVYIAATIALAVAVFLGGLLWVKRRRV